MQIDRDRLRRAAVDEPGPELAAPSRQILQPGQGLRAEQGAADGQGIAGNSVQPVEVAAADQSQLMIAHDRNDAVSLQGPHHFLGLRAVADVVAQRKNPVCPLLGNIDQHRFQRSIIAVDVGHNRQQHYLVRIVSPCRPGPPCASTGEPMRKPASA